MPLFEPTELEQRRRSLSSGQASFNRAEGGFLNANHRICSGFWGVSHGAQSSPGGAQRLFRENSSKFSEIPSCLAAAEASWALDEASCAVDEAWFGWQKLRVPWGRSRCGGWNLTLGGRSLAGVCERLLSVGPHPCRPALGEPAYRACCFLQKAHKVRTVLPTPRHKRDAITHSRAS